MPLNIALNALNRTNQNDQIASFALELFFGEGWQGNSPYAERLAVFLDDCIVAGVVSDRNQNSVLTAVYAFAGHIFVTEPNEAYPVADVVGISNQAAAGLEGHGHNTYQEILHQLKGGQQRGYGNNGGRFANQNNYQGRNTQQRGYSNNGGSRNSFGSYGNNGGGNRYTNQGGYGQQRGSRPNMNGTYGNDFQSAPRFGQSGGYNNNSSAAAGQALMEKLCQEHHQAKAQRQGRINGNNQPTGNENFFSAAPKININQEAPQERRHQKIEDFPNPANLNTVTPRYEVVTEENIAKPMGAKVDTTVNKWALMEEEIGEPVPEEWRDLPWDIRYHATLLYSYRTRKPFWKTVEICGITYLSVGFKKVDDMNRADHEFPTFGAALDNAPALDLTPAIEQIKDSIGNPDRYDPTSRRNAIEEHKALTEKLEKEWAEWENTNHDKPEEEQTPEPATIPDEPGKVNFLAEKATLFGHELGTVRSRLYSTRSNLIKEDAINVLSANYYSYNYIGTYMPKETVKAINMAFSQVSGINKSNGQRFISPVDFSKILDAVVNNLANAETGEALDKLFTNVINNILAYNFGIGDRIESVLTAPDGTNDLADLATNIKQHRGEAFYKALSAFQWNIMNRLSTMVGGNAISCNSENFIGQVVNHNMVEIVANPLSMECRGIAAESEKLRIACDADGSFLITEEASPELYSILFKFMPRYNENEYREVEVIIGNAVYKAYLNYLDSNRDTKANANSFVLVAQK